MLPRPRRSPAGLDLRTAAHARAFLALSPADGRVEASSPGEMLDVPNREGPHRAGHLTSGSAGMAGQLHRTRPFSCCRYTAALARRRAALASAPLAAGAASFASDDTLLMTEIMVRSVPNTSAALTQASVNGRRS